MAASLMSTSSPPLVSFGIDKVRSREDFEHTVAEIGVGKFCCPSDQMPVVNDCWGHHAHPIHWSVRALGQSLGRFRAYCKGFEVAMVNAHRLLQRHQAANVVRAVLMEALDFDARPCCRTGHFSESFYN